MKKFAVLCCSMVFAVMIFTGCKKESTDTSIAYNMTASINGVPFSTQSCLGGIGINNSLLIAGGAGSDYPIISINIDTFRGVGVYALGTQSISFIMDSTAQSSTALKGISGSVTITSTSPAYSGTFSFVCQDSTRVTNGVFTAKL